MDRKERQRQRYLKTHPRVCKECGGSRPKGRQLCPRCAHERHLARRRRREKSPAAQAARERWRRENPERWAAIQRRNTLKREYGITPEQYDQMLVEQAGGCAVCGQPPNGKRLHIDHCHTTGKIRGLLCSGCNRALGYLQDDPELLRVAIKYLT